MNEDHDRRGESDAEADPKVGLSRRTFVAQLGGVGVASLTVWPIFARSENAAALSTDQIDNAISPALNDATQENHTMPLIRIDAFEGRSDAEVKTLLDSAHRAVVKAIHINERDRYQIYEAHAKSRFVMQDTGLGIPRTDKALIITIVSKGRAEILKRRLYKEMTEELQRSVSIAPSDVMIVFVENAAADWSFGNGDPQFLSGELG
jgi:phenylpyruvate tautomerase PptA (4-oxalocrotonate tautomerase family)